MKQIVFLICFLLSFGQGMGATLSVCSSGCDYTTIAAAMSAAVSTDIVELRGNISEEVVLNKNIAGIQGDSPTSRRTWNSTSAGDVFQIQSGLNQAMTVKDLIMVQDTDAAIIWQPTSGASSAIRFENVQFSYSTARARHFYYNSNGNHLGMVTFNRCEFIGNGSASGAMNFDVATNTGAVTVMNSIFRGFTAANAYGIRMNQNTSNASLYNLNNTFYGNSVGVSLLGRAVHTNCVFGGNTDDLGLGGSPVTVLDFSYCAFAEQAGTGGTFGSGCIFGITVGNEFVNTATPDLHVKNASAQIYNSGTTLAAVTTDFDGIARPQGAAYDIGAFEFLALGGGKIYNRQRRGH